MLAARGGDDDDGRLAASSSNSCSGLPPYPHLTPVCYFVPPPPQPAY